MRPFSLAKGDSRGQENCPQTFEDFSGEEEADCSVQPPRVELSSKGGSESEESVPQGQWYKLPINVIQAKAGCPLGRWTVEGRAALDERLCSAPHL